MLLETHPNTQKLHMTVPAKDLLSKEKGIEQIADNDFLLRIHRAISWVDKAQSLGGDDDIQFLCYWIAFNAAYSKKDFEGTEKKVQRDYFNKISELDTENRLYNTIWEIFPSQIRNLMNCKYIFSPFWEYQEGKISEEKCNNKFSIDKKQFYHAFNTQKTGDVLSTVFRRLYVLRNQLFHGSATYKSSKNREQVTISTALVNELVPVCIDVMLDNYDVDWGNPLYPVVDK